ncbi:Histone acetyltransferase [Trichinella patagoniensis]|uniref:histone acetyltransferase n=1 Tax=Trichinella patagoniensis TaxID=990121 RepID=A0A0V0Z5P5_9BILA|nr:Histone acetyltransferase [Trichinella patagoniensis]
MSDRQLQTKGLESVKGKEMIDFTEFHTKEEEKFQTTCACCKGTDAIFHCTICVKFDLCRACYENSNHKHNMEPMKAVSIHEYTAHCASPISSECISRMKEEEEHYRHCPDNDCSMFYCRKIKRILDHVLICHRSVNCKYYRQFLKLRSLHAEHCHAKYCIVAIYQKKLEESTKLTEECNCNMKLASLFEKVAVPSGVGDPDDHAVLDNVFVDFTLARRQAALFGTEMLNGRSASPRTVPEERNAELETIKIAHASIMEEEPLDYLYNLGLVQQNSTDSCHFAITSSVKMVDEGPQRDSCLESVKGKEMIDFTEFHTKEEEKFQTTCACCKGTDAIFHCTICVKFDLCRACYENSNHKHNMEPMKAVSIHEYTAHCASPISSECISRMKEEEEHYRHCPDNDCSMFYCRKIKRILDHVLICHRSVNCKYYRQFLKLRSLHAEHCHAKYCIVAIYQKKLEESTKLTEECNCNMKLASLFEKVAVPSGVGDPDDHAVLDNVFVDFTLARRQAALFGTEMLNGRSASPRTVPEERNAELETIKIAHGTNAALI